jgi:hypothetical protein
MLKSTSQAYISHENISHWFNDSVYYKRLAVQTIIPSLI